MMTRCLRTLALLTTFSITSAQAIEVDTLVSPEWLKQHLTDPGLAIIEMSEVASFEFGGHIPGAVYTNKSEWRNEAEDGALIHHETERLEQMFRDLGVDSTDGVVIYYKGSDSNEMLGAYYLLWLLHLLGHTNVGILDQGWHGWQEAWGPVASESNEVIAGNFKARPLPGLEISTTELADIRSSYMVIDGRPASHFQGAAKFPANPKYGRIPDSLSQPWENYVRQTVDGAYYIEQPKAVPLFELHQPPADRPILLTCFGGTGAAVNYAVFYALGHRNMRMDDAGLRRWNAQDRPLVVEAARP